MLIKGTGTSARPVRPDFLEEPTDDELLGRSKFLGVVGSLMDAVREGRPAPCSGHDYRQVLEVAAAIKLSAREGHRRVALPLTDRSATVMPMPYRWHGGDVTGWEVINRGEPTPIEPAELTPDTVYVGACENQWTRSAETRRWRGRTSPSSAPRTKRTPPRYASVHTFGE